MGRRAAGAGFLRALAERNPAKVFAFSPDQEESRHLADELRGYGATSGAPDWIPFTAHHRLAEAGLLYCPDPNIGPFAWRRARHDPRAYSVCGITHTLLSKTGMEMLCDIVLSPVEPWDALICTSAAVRDSVDQLLWAMATFLRGRFGAQRMILPELATIPLGVHSRDFAPSPAARAEARLALGIEEDELALLYVGRFAPHGKAHPLPMLLAAEEAARGRKVVLLQAGWFASEGAEAIIRAEATRFAPSLRHLIVDGRRADEVRRAWLAGDVFTSLVDNFQETFGLTPIEAMAAGLPCVVTDWDGYKDTVRHGVDGLRIPTLTLPPGPADFLADYFDSDLISYDLYCGLTSQMVAVDVRKAREAYSALFADAGLRRSMGEAGRQRAIAEFDWAHIIRRYEGLWAELARRRLAADPSTVIRTPLRPSRMNPFAMFRSYPTATVSMETRVGLVEGAGLEIARERLGAATLQTGFAYLTHSHAVDQVVSVLGNKTDFESLTAMKAELPDVSEPLLLRTVVALLKVGVLEAEPPQPIRSNDTPGG